MSKSGKGYSIDEKQRAIEKYADGIAYSARYSGELQRAAQEIIEPLLIFRLLNLVDDKYEYR